MSFLVEVTNETDLALVDGALARLAEEVLRTRDARGVLAIALVDEPAMAELNQTYRGQEGPTDVLSFPELPDEAWPSPGGDEHLGDVVICPSYAAANAAEDGLTLDEELTRLVVHGVLHILGWDHETDQGEMRELEQTLLDRLERHQLSVGPV